MTRRFQALFKGEPIYLTTEIHTTLQMWDSDQGFRQIIAAVDHFYTRFPNSTNARFRIATLQSKWRDCTALKTLMQVKGPLGLPGLADLVGWMWEPELEEDMYRILRRPIPLADDPHGYLPYMSDYGLSTRTPYSVTANKAIHLFCQVLLCAQGNPRGWNARMVFPNAPTRILKNALIAAFALIGSPDWAYRMGPASDKERLAL